MSKATTAERALNRKGGTMSRLIKTLFGFYPVLLPLVVVGVVLCAIINSIGATFLQSALQIISESWQSGDWEAAQPKIAQLVTTLACIYGIGILSSLFWNRAMAIVTQGSLEKLREKMFNRMQDLPIRYFDTHQRGDIMSHYTNDIDTLRQMISQSLPNLLMTTIVIVTVFFIMLYYSVWMCLVIVAGVAFMTFMTKLLGSNSARFFIAQQTELGVVEGHIEEVMNGQKVVKAFCHESAAEADFDERNEKLFEVSQKANMYANILMPILGNLGDLLYVLVALTGGIFLALGVPNLSLSGMALSIAVVVPFLNMTKQFCGQIGQISQQINAVVMGLAGADRIFELIDEKPETDEGYVTLVNAQVNPDTWQLEEADHHTGMWAWKHPHRATGEIEYVPLRGDLVMDNVDFGYTPDHEVLHGVSVFAKPGQKVAFVGATGAGKTTLAVPHACLDVITNRVDTAVMTGSFGNLLQLRMHASEKDAVAVGPGLGRNEEAATLARNFITTTDRPLVVDADGLWILGHIDRLEGALTNRERPAILTPHPGEFARLSGIAPDVMEQDRIGTARAFAMKYKVVLVLKGAPTVIAAPNGDVAVDTAGNPGMAIGGMGDVLTGIVTSLLGQGATEWEAACAGVYLHSAAADVLAKTKPQGFAPDDVADAVPGVIGALLK